MVQFQRSGNAVGGCAWQAGVVAKFCECFITRTNRACDGNCAVEDFNPGTFVILSHSSNPSIS